MSIRQVSNRGGNIIGRFPSAKLGRMVSFESLLERDFIYWLEFEPTVRWFKEQPLTITYEAAGRVYHYTPDFQVIDQADHLLVECKPQRFVNTPDNQRKFAAARAWCAKNNGHFAVITAEQLSQGYQLANIKQLIQFARYPVDPGLKQCIHAFLQACSSPVTLAEVMQSVAPEAPQQVLIPLLTMAFQHHLVLNLAEAPLSTQTAVELAAHLHQGGVR